MSSGAVSNASSSNQPQVLTNNSVSSIPLNDSQVTFLVDELVSTGMMSESQARQVLAMMSPSQLNQFYQLASGNSDLELEEMAAAVGFSNDEIQALLAPQNGIVLSTNPFGGIFLRFMQLAYSLEIDLKELMHVMVQRQLDLSIEAAEERFNGAIVQFACAMAAGVLTAAAGGVGMYAWARNRNGKALDEQSLIKQAADSQWASPIGVSLLGQPLTAAGEFGNQYYQFEGATTQAFAEEAGRLYEQLLNMFQTIRESDKNMASGA